MGGHGEELSVGRTTDGIFKRLSSCVVVVRVVVVRVDGVCVCVDSVSVGVVGGRSGVPSC